MWGTAKQRHGAVAHRSRAPRRRLGAVLIALSVAASTWAGAAPPALADPGPQAPSPDLVTVTGYDFRTERPADVVVGRRANLVITYATLQGLDDGLITVTLPEPAWPSALRTGGRLVGDASDDGSVVVRPVETDFPAQADGCTVPAEPVVLERPTEHLLLLPNVDCRPGQHLAIRVFGIRAPKTVGRHPVTVSVSDGSGLIGDSSLRLPVVKKPTRRLAVDVPGQVTLQRPTQVLVRVLTRSGRLDTGYRGVVAVEDLGGLDCAPLAVVELTAADAGVKVATVELPSPGARRLTVRDVTHRAITGRSRSYTEVVPDDYSPQTCSTAYH